MYGASQRNPFLSPGFTAKALGKFNNIFEVLRLARGIRQSAVNMPSGVHHDEEGPNSAKILSILR